MCCFFFFLLLFIYFLNVKKKKRRICLSALGRSDEAAMFEFAAACRLRQPKLKIQALQQCLVSGFSVPILENEIKYVKEYINSL